MLQETPCLKADNTKEEKGNRVENKNKKEKTKNKKQFCLCLVPI